MERAPSGSLTFPHRVASWPLGESRRDARPSSEVRDERITGYDQAAGRLVRSARCAALRDAGPYRVFEVHHAPRNRPPYSSEQAEP